MKFILTDDSVDRDSERILVTGLKTDNFEKNPVMLYQHRQDSWWTGKEAPLPIGYWNNITREGNKITAEPVFNDTLLAQEVKALVEHGTLRACSIGFKAISYSNEPELMLPGQKYATITSAELLEASIVMIPANPNAVAVKSFSKDGTKYEVSGESKLTEEQIQKLDAAAKQFHKSQNKPNDMTKLFEDLKKSINEDLKGMKSLIEKFTGKKDATEPTVVTADQVKEFTGKVEAIEKSLVDLEKENTDLNTAKEAAEASVKSLTTEKETLVSEKAALVTDKETLTKRVTELENSEKELKAANLKLSGGKDEEATVIDDKNKNDEVPEAPKDETPQQKSQRIAKMLEKVDAK
jgi:HK97 family phage prohead protease